MCIIPNELLHQLHEEHLILFAQHVHLLHEGDILVFQKPSIGFGSKHYNINMFIIPNEIHHQLNDKHLHLIVQHVHLLHEDDILVFQKYFHWIWLKKLDLKCMHHTKWTTPSTTWWTSTSPCSTCPPTPWRWYPVIPKILPFDLALTMIL